MVSCNIWKVQLNRAEPFNLYNHLYNVHHNCLPLFLQSVFKVVSKHLATYLPLADLIPDLTTAVPPVPFPFNVSFHSVLDCTALHVLFIQFRDGVDQGGVVGMGAGSKIRP